jgi:hypothetical protein
MPGRRAFLRRRHVAAAAMRRAIIDVIEARRARFGVMRRRRPSARASWPRSDSGRRRVIPTRSVSSPWPNASAAARRGRPPPRRLPASRRAPAHGGSVRSELRSSPGRSARPARAVPGPAAPSAGRSRPARSRRSERTSSSEPEWTRNDTCGRYSGYGEDITVDNVSSPGPRTRRGYSEDTQIRAGDNGGYARGLGPRAGLPIVSRARVQG